MPIIEVKINMSGPREKAYLQALRERYGQPTWDWSWLIARALREVYALQMAERETLREGDRTND